jgi:hypothetical protein
MIGIATLDNREHHTRPRRTEDKEIRAMTRRDYEKAAEKLDNGNLLTEEIADVVDRAMSDGITVKEALADLRAEGIID